MKTISYLLSHTLLDNFIGKKSRYWTIRKPCYGMHFTNPTSLHVSPLDTSRQIPVHISSQVTVHAYVTACKTPTLQKWDMTRDKQYSCMLIIYRCTGDSFDKLSTASERLGGFLMYNIYPSTWNHPLNIPDLKSKGYIMRYEWITFTFI